MTTPALAASAADLRRLRRPGQSLALVPTMGALHEGHLSLARIAQRHADQVVVSIFVNPTQFGPGEDFERYPRTMERDLAALAEVGVDAVFAPAVEEMYPGFPAPAGVTIDPGPVGNALEGAIRPGHFAGVCQVVAKLFHLVQPDIAVFGQKDAQQLSIIKQMVRDLSFPVRIVAGPIVRDADGLALSSRNAYLSPQERESALTLSRSLGDGSRQSDPEAAVAATWRELASDPAVAPEYAALVRADTFAPVLTRTPEGLLRGDVGVFASGILLVAARVGTTRLIDNQEVKYG